MTEETREQLFGQYWATKKAVASYGLSEEFEEEPTVATAANSYAAWATTATIGRQSDVHLQTVSRDYPRFIYATAGVGKTYIVVLHGRDSVKPPGNLTATLVTSGTAATPIPPVEGGSMATQQPPTTEDESVEEIIWRVGTTFAVGYKAKLAARLTELQRAVQEDEPDGHGITAKSLQRFTELLKAYPTLKCPIISVTPEQNIYASWKAGPNRLFSVHFLPDGNARFVIFCPNDKHPNETIRLSGTATVDVLINLAQPHGVLAWSSE
jgi:hypothetical protein